MAYISSVNTAAGTDLYAKYGGGMDLINNPGANMEL